MKQHRIETIENLDGKIIGLTDVANDIDAICVTYGGWTVNPVILEAIVNKCNNYPLLQTRIEELENRLSTVNDFLKVLKFKDVNMTQLVNDTIKLNDMILKEDNNG